MCPPPLHAEVHLCSPPELQDLISCAIRWYWSSVASSPRSANAGPFCGAACFAKLAIQETERSHTSCRLENAAASTAEEAMHLARGAGQNGATWHDCALDVPREPQQDIHMARLLRDLVSPNWPRVVAQLRVARQGHHRRRPAGGNHCRLRQILQTKDP